MESVTSASSEEELLRLREDGKITESEYDELLEALQKGPKAVPNVTLVDRPTAARTSGLAIASLVCSLLGPCCSLPAIICGHVALRKIQRDPALTGRGIALAGLIIGYVILAFSIPFLLLWGLYTERRVEQRQTAVIAQQITELRRFPLDSTDGVLTQSGVTFDEQISADGNGSLRIEVTEPTTISLFDTGDIDIENARLIYQAQMRTQDVDHDACLEMWCHFPGSSDFFSRDPTPVWGTTAWMTQETIFFLKDGENPDNVRLNLIINGRGTVWIDDIRLMKGPLR
ncbi:MAG: DUF4190 domain-containing protein [Phycisphaerales bacterium]|nr:MAG: DUF4190 domain-containing protein [Phycisphaerales bacterium]